MKTRVRSATAAALAAALISGSAAAQPTPAPSFSPDAFKAHVAFLADDLLAGRKPGTTGYDTAALYVAQQFAAIGLQPAGDQGGWYQAVQLQRTAFAAPPSFEVTGAAGRKPLVYADDYVTAPGPYEDRTRIDLPLVFAGWGLDSPENGFDDYKGLDVAGKGVVVLYGVPAGTPSEIGAHLSDQKGRTAERHGAAAVFFLATPTLEKVYPWSKIREGADDPVVNWVAADGTPHTDTPKLKTGALLSTSGAAAVFEGAPRPLAKVMKEAERTNARPKGFPLKTTLSVAVDGRRERFLSQNVVALLPGADPTLKDEIVLVMAHLDHLGTRPEKQGDKIYNGAMDNASGVATMLETARALAAGPRPKRSVLFVAVTAEEEGLIGSDFFANNPAVPLERVVGVVNMDMPILTYDFADVVGFGSESSTLGETMRTALERVGLKLAPDPMPEQGLFTRSDHYSLVKKGVPSVFLATGPNRVGQTKPNSGLDAWGAFLSSNYHEVSDEIGQKDIDWNAGAKFALANWAIVSAVADAPARPLWYEGDFFGKTFAPSAAKATKPKG